MTMSTALTAMTRMLSHNPCRIAGIDATATSQSKNDALTRGHPGEDTSASTATATSASVETTATAVDRRARLRR